VDHHLTANYTVFAPDLREQAGIIEETSSSGGPYVVAPMVFAYGWNEDFIIARQHPVSGSFDRVFTGVTNWFILEVATGTVHGPLTEGEYLELRQTLGVPDDLTFTSVIDVE
jgi:hypothetical protein